MYLYWGVINKYTAHSIGFGIVFLHPSPRVKKILTVALKEYKKKKKSSFHIKTYFTKLSILPCLGFSEEIHF